ncbi:MAG: HD domain-containing protein [Bacilli bacterium]|nr:HD domain-containing protein [Bacilli bacterium]
MIDFNYAKKAFKDYLKNYDLSIGMIKLKVTHTYGVVSLSEYIARDLNLCEEDIELAKLIALLHDIGRFEQARQYGDYIDYKTVDHADLGVKILFDDNLIRKFIKDNKYDNIILKAIKNHNRLAIEDLLNEKELLHAKIIRDADKADNFRVKTTEKIENICNLNIKEMENSEITDKIYNDFMNSKVIITKDRKTGIDFWISYIAFIFDFNYKSGLKYVSNKNYINIMVDRINYNNPVTKEKMEIIRNHALNYIKMKLEEK